MKILLVPWMLLLLGVNLNSGHYIRDLEYGKPNLYQVREGSSGVTFENPKPDMPTLREILYYHIIERPREEHTITERSFTNSHGFQFLEPEPLSEEYDEKEHAEHDENELEHADENQEYNGKDEDTEIHEEETEATTEAKPLTDEDVKEAYKSRSYLFDQMRQRYAVKRMAVPEASKRRKRQAETQLPDAPNLSDRDFPKTYGMNLNPNGGYVWNNLNTPPTYYELGPTNGNPNEGQYESAQSQDNLPPPSGTIPPSETSDSGSSEDIYVNTNRPSAMSLEIEPGKTNPEVANDDPAPINDNPEPINENPDNVSGANPVEPIISNDETESNEGFSNTPIGPEVYDNPELSPVEPVANTQEAEAPQAETPVSDEPTESIGESNVNPGSIPNGQQQPEESSENPGYGYGQTELEEPKPDSPPEKGSEGEKIKDIPVAPTLPPLNYDNLPDYIRDAISSTEKPTSSVQTDNPYINPQTSPDDKKVLEDNMEGIFATMQPVEDIPKTYGMNLTSDGGHVWNELVNPPVSYDVGSPSNPEEEQTQAPNYQPEIHEPDNPIPEPAEPEKEEPNTYPGQPNQEPEINEPENPIPEPAEPEKEEPNAYPEQPNQEPQINEPENPIPEPVEPEKEEPNTYPEQPNQEPEINEPENPIPEPAEPEKEEPNIYQERPNQEPEIHESEEAKPIEELIPQEPEKEGELEEPISDPSQEPPEADNESEAQVPENEGNKPTKEPSESIEPVQPEPAVETENPGLVPEPENEDNHEIDETVQPGAEKPNEENNDHVEEPENNPVEDITEEENNKADMMSELLKSEQFWKWLGEWTATYMELLEKHMRKIAIQEICKREKAGEQMCPLEDNPEDTGVVIKDGKIIVDGEEIDITHTDNLDSEVKGHHNNKHDNKGTNGNKVEASTIYGNSVGNDKVTNVFIFTAEKAEEVIDKLKPVNDSDVDFVIDDRIKEDNKDEPNKEKSIEDESNVEELNIDNINTDLNEGAANNEEISKSESNEEAPTEELNKESNEGIPNKESNVSDANTEELNYEKAIKESNESINNDSNKNEQNSDLDVDAEVLNKNGELGADIAEINKDNENESPKDTSGDIGEIDDEANDSNDNSKLDSSEKNISNSKEYLEKK